MKWQFFTRLCIVQYSSSLHFFLQRCLTPKPRFSMLKFPHNSMGKVRNPWAGQSRLGALEKTPSMRLHLLTTTRFSLEAVSLHPFSLEIMDTIPINSDLMIWMVSSPSPMKQTNGISVNRSAALVSIQWMRLH